MFTAYVSKLLWLKCLLYDDQYRVQVYYLSTIYDDEEWLGGICNLKKAEASEATGSFITYRHYDYDTSRWYNKYRIDVEKDTFKKGIHYVEYTELFNFDKEGFCVNLENFKVYRRDNTYYCWCNGLYAKCNAVIYDAVGLNEGGTQFVAYNHLSLLVPLKTTAMSRSQFERRILFN